MPRLKVAIVGSGLIAKKKHLPSFLRLRQKIEVAAICDLDENKAKELARIFHIKKVFTDFTQMLREIKPDIVDISTPPSTHAKLSIEAIQNNCHVLLEKPMALSLADCDAIIDAANRLDRKICVIHNQIFNPVFVKARKIVSNGQIGKFLGMRIILITPCDYMTSLNDHWAHKLPGGVLGETGPHALYLSQAFLNNINDVRVYAKKQIPEFTWSRFEDFRIELLADNGICSVVLLYSTNQWKAEIDIFASSGTLKIDLQNHVLLKYNRTDLVPFHIAKSSFAQALLTMKETTFNSIKYMFRKNFNPHSVVISGFVDSILNNAPPPITAKEGREVVRVMQMLIESLNKI